MINRLIKEKVATLRHMYVVCGFASHFTDKIAKNDTYCMRAWMPLFVLARDEAPRNGSADKQ